MAVCITLDRIFRIRRLATLSHFQTIQLIRSNSSFAESTQRNLSLSWWLIHPNKVSNRCSVDSRRLYSATTSNPTSPPPPSSTARSEEAENLESFRAREVEREEAFNQTHNEQQENDTKINKIRSDILTVSLPFVREHGWSIEAIVKGAESIGYPGVIHGLFPQGAIELINHFQIQSNRKLIEILIDELKENKVENPIDVVRRALRIRLEMNEPYLAHWHEALAMLSLPQNVPTTLAQLLTLIDDICYYSGDRSVDFNWYTRRIGLATIYKMTELFMLRDKSPNHIDTWTFLDRRLDEAVRIQSTIDLSGPSTETLRHVLGAAFVTARNILGINLNRR